MTYGSRAREAEFFREPYGLAITVLEQFGGLHRITSVAEYILLVYISRGTLARSKAASGRMARVVQGASFAPLATIKLVALVQSAAMRPMSAAPMLAGTSARRISACARRIPSGCRGRFRAFLGGGRLQPAEVHVDLHEGLIPLGHELQLSRITTPRDFSRSPSERLKAISRRRMSQVCRRDAWRAREGIHR